MIRFNAWLWWAGARRVTTAIVIAAALSPPAGAQDGQNAATEQTIREVIIDLSSVIERFEPPLRRPPTIGFSVTPTPSDVPAAELAKVRFVLRAVDLDGAVMFDPALFAPLWTNLIGREVSLLDMRALLHEIEQLYKKQDYYMLALMAPGDFHRSGRVRIIIYESFIEEVVIQGDVPHLAERLQPYIDKIVAMSPLRVSKLLRYLLLISDLAGIELDASFSKLGDIPGAGRLVLKVDFTPRVLHSRFDNFGAKDTGPMEFLAEGHFNDTLGLFEWTEGKAVTNPVDPKELVLLRLSQHFPLGPSGFASGYEYSHASSIRRSKPGNLDLDVRTVKDRAYLDYALIRSLDRNLIPSLSLRGKEVDVNIRHRIPRLDRKRWLTGGGIYSDTIAGVSILAEMAMAHGIDGLDATGLDNDYRFATIEGHLSRDLSKKLSANILFIGQYAMTELPHILNFHLGGENYGRAFDWAVISGEEGLAAVYEMTRHIDTNIDWVTSFSLFGFVDYGAVWNPRGRRDYTFASIGSIGAGFHSLMYKHVVLTAYIAVPYKYEPQLGAGGGAKFRFIAGVRF